MASARAVLNHKIHHNHEGRKGTAGHVSSQESAFPHGRAGSLQIDAREAVPGKQALHSLICVNNVCVLPIEHPELSMLCYMIGKLWPLLVHGDREPEWIGQEHLLQKTQTPRCHN